MYSLIVRLVGVMSAMVPPALMGHHLWMHGNDRHGEGTSTFITLLLLMCIVSIPGGYIAIAGPKADRPQGFRLRCIVQIAVGLGMLVVWLLVMVIGNYLTWLLGFMFIWYGILGIAAVNMSLGLFSLISNRELLHEMSEINLFGKRESTS